MKLEFQQGEYVRLVDTIATVPIIHKFKLNEKEDVNFGSIVVAYALKYKPTNVRIFTCQPSPYQNLSMNFHHPWDVEVAIRSVDHLGNDLTWRKDLKWKVKRIVKHPFGTFLFLIMSNENHMFVCSTSAIEHEIYTKHF